MFDFLSFYCVFLFILSLYVCMYFVFYVLLVGVIKDDDDDDDDWHALFVGLWHLMR